MQIIETKNSDKEKWDDFVLANKGDFLQSWEWGEFQKSFGKTIWRLAVIDEKSEFLAAALLIKHRLPLGKNYLYCSRGPLLKIPNPKFQPPNKIQIKNFEALKLIFDKIKEIAKKENSVFLKWEPAASCFNVIASLEYSGHGNPVSVEINSDFYKSFEIVNSSVNLQPHDTLILDLNKAEEELLAGMKQKTRYNIRLAEKHGVKVRVSDKDTFEPDFEKFWDLTEETTSRDKFQSHDKEYYRVMLKNLGGGISSKKCTAKLFLAEFEGKILAANIMIFFGDRAIYLHGASGAAHRNLMAPYLLQWEQIKKSREMGFKEYDFWGVKSRLQPATRNPQPNNWEGITRFKTGFGGREINYPDAIDIVYQTMFYKAIKVAKKVKAILR